MKKIKISESQYKRLFKGHLNEAGGYDDLGIMALHGSATTGLLKSTIDHIAKILEDTEQAFEMDLRKEDIMAGITLMSDVLHKIKEALKKITPELVNDDLKLAAKELFITVRNSENKLRLLSNTTHSSSYLQMPPAMTGMGFAMSPKDVNDFLFNILVDLDNSTEKLAFQVMDEMRILSRRLSNN